MPLSRTVRRPLLSAGRADHGPDDQRVGSSCSSCRGSARVPLVAAGDVHYHVPRAAGAARRADGHSPAARTVAEAGEHLFPNAERHLKSPEEMAALFADAARGAARARWRSPSAARSRSTSCATNIPRNWPRRARRRCEYLARLAWAGRGERYPRRRARQSPRRCSSTSCS